MTKDDISNINSDVNSQKESVENLENEVLTDKELLEDFLNCLDHNDEDTTDDETIISETRINKFLYVIKLKESELKKCELLAHDTFTKTQNWLDSRQRRIISTIEYLTNQMQNYLRTQNQKSLSLPNGSIGFRKQPDSIEITNEELFLSIAGPDMLKHIPEKYQPDLNAIKKHLKLTGDLPDGVELISKGDKFYYKLES